MPGGCCCCCGAGEGEYPLAEGEGEYPFSPVISQHFKSMKVRGITMVAQLQYVIYLTINFKYLLLYNAKMKGRMQEIRKGIYIMYQYLGNIMFY